MALTLTAASHLAATRTASAQRAATEAAAVPFALTSHRNELFGCSGAKADSLRVAAARSAVTRHRPCAARASVAVGESELDVVTKYSEVVPDTVVGDDFERFKPTAATVTSSLILGISSLPEAKYDAAIESALAYGKCLVDEKNKFACFLDKALVNVGAELSRVVAGRVSTEVDPRLAHDTQAIVDKVRNLVKLYAEVEVPLGRLLFKIPATWEGIDAARQLEDDGIQTHVTGVNGFAQAAACAQANVSVIQISVGRVRDWARTHSGDDEIDAAVASGQDPGISMVNRAYDFIAKHGFRTKVMASNIRNKDDALGLLGVDYLIVPLKVLEALRSTPADDASSYKPVAAPAAKQTSAQAEVDSWSKSRYDEEVGACAKELLEGEIESAVAQTKRVEEYFAKIWPPPNV